MVMHLVLYVWTEKLTGSCWKYSPLDGTLDEFFNQQDKGGWQQDIHLLKSGMGHNRSVRG